jgi:hypothetical protein
MTDLPVIVQLAGIAIALVGLVLTTQWRISTSENRIVEKIDDLKREIDTKVDQLEHDFVNFKVKVSEDYLTRGHADNSMQAIASEMRLHRTDMTARLIRIEDRMMKAPAPRLAELD